MTGYANATPSGHIFIGEDLQMVSVSDLTADQDIEGVELRLVIVPAASAAR